MMMGQSLYTPRFGARLVAKVTFFFGTVRSSGAPTDQKVASEDLGGNARAKGDHLCAEPGPLEGSCLVDPRASDLSIDQLHAGGGQKPANSRPILANSVSCNKSIAKSQLRR